MAYVDGFLTPVPKKKLAEYKRKRDPKKTPEPFGGKKRGKEPIFVVHRDDARRLHYDFRLERNGALASWAVPKGIPLEPGQQHLAVHVEDRRLDDGVLRRAANPRRDVPPIVPVGFDLGSGGPR